MMSDKSIGSQRRSLMYLRHDHQPTVNVNVVGCIYQTLMGTSYTDLLRSLHSAFFMGEIFAYYMYL